MFVATLSIVALILAACTSSGGDTESGATGVTTSSVEDAVTPVSTAMRDEVVFGSDGGQGISTWAVGNVFANPCHSNDTLLDPPIDPSVDGLVAGLAGQKGHPATTPTDVEVDGYAGTYMEMTVPAGIDVADCDHGEFRTWADPSGGCCRYLEAGQRDMLWILDVDGDRLVIDAALGPDTTPQDRADRTQMVESIRIEPI